VRKQLIFGHIGTLLIGGLIYILFRTTTLKMFGWYDRLGLSNSISNLRDYSEPLIKDIPNWFMYSLPDGLWIFSYISLMLYIWKNSISRNSAIWIFIIPFIAIISEFGQLFKLVPGTFDIIDLLFYVLGIFLPLLIFNNSLNFKNQTI
jgi:hypothetical protein